MRNGFKRLCIVGLLGLGGWFGYRLFKYVTHATSPALDIQGIAQGGVYGSRCAFCVNGSSNYGLRTLSVLLDGELAPSFPRALNNHTCAESVVLDLSNSSQGRHTIAITLCDACYRAHDVSQTFSITVDHEPLVLEPVHESYTVQRGRSIHAQFKASKSLTRAVARFGDYIYECCPESERSLVYECFVPTDCEDPAGDVPLIIDATDAAGTRSELCVMVHATPFEIKKGGFRSTSLAHKLAEEKELSANTKLLEETLTRELNNSPAQKLWRGAFVAPCEIQSISTPYGQLRTSAEKGRYIHKAVDILDTPRNVIWASQAGRVIVKDRFLFPGNVVVIDHGLGIITMYSHLEDFADISVGDMVKKGQPIGKLGKTGYANGYHLHWELRIKNIAVDPIQWIEPGF